MDGLLTVKHDYYTPWLDDLMERAKKRRKDYKYSKSACYLNNTFQVNPKWHKAYGGRGNEEN